MKKKIEEQVVNLKWPNGDDYLNFLKKALDDYHQMVNNGTLTPRGNKIATIIVDKGNF